MGRAATPPADSVVEKRRVNAQMVLKSKLTPAGGGAIRLVPVREPERSEARQAAMSLRGPSGSRRTQMKAFYSVSISSVLPVLPAVADVTVASPDGRCALCCPRAHRATSSTP